MMVGDAILNATTFVGGSYLAKYLSGDSIKVALFEKERHDKALEKFQKDYASYEEKRQRFLNWGEDNRRKNLISSHDFSNTDEALKPYNRFHPDENLSGEPPQFSDYYRPSKNLKLGEMIYVGGGMLAVGYIASRWL